MPNASDSNPLNTDPNTTPHGNRYFHTGSDSHTDANSYTVDDAHTRASRPPRADPLH